MKIEVIKGKVGDHGVGEVIEADDKAAERLIKLGYAKKSDGKSSGGESKQAQAGGNGASPPQAGGSAGASK